MDRISCLPDEVIFHILSFLSIMESVKTSALSKRWKFIWVRVPFLEFNIDDTDRDLDYDCVDAKDWILNSKIINKILLLHTHDIHTFHYINANHDYEEDIDGSEEEFQSWIVNITLRNIRNLVIRLHNQFVLPQCMFTCKTLIDLSLTGCGDIPMSDIYFPVLKKLKLHNVGYESNESLGHLISACPVLEELSVDGILLGHCCVSSPTLTRLSLKLWGSKNLNFEVKLDTPAVRYLRLAFSYVDKFSVGALNSLIEANVYLSPYGLNQDNFILSLLEFVGKLYNVQLLTLSMNRTVVIHYSAFSALGIKFPNLTKLDLRTNICFITNFLENANNLRVLELSWITVDIYNQSSWMETKRVPACLISHLQSVAFKFWCNKYEFDILRYILRNAKVLKRMVIHTQLPKCDMEKKFEALKQLALFERGSQECQLVFE